MLGYNCSPIVHSAFYCEKLHLVQIRTGTDFRYDKVRCYNLALDYSKYRNNSSSEPPTPLKLRFCVTQLHSNTGLLKKNILSENWIYTSRRTEFQTYIRFADKIHSDSWWGAFAPPPLCSYTTAIVTRKTAYINGMVNYHRSLVPLRDNMR